MGTAIVIAVAAVVFGVSATATSLALRFITSRRILDQPNERSSHTRATPRGLGIGFLPVLLVSWLTIAPFLPSAPAELWWICAGSSLLAIMSWVDDVRGLPAGRRLFGQLIVVFVGVMIFQEPQLFRPLGVGPILGGLATIILWVGLINQVNFTDGIDGNLGVMAICTGSGLFLVSILGSGSYTMGALGLTTAAAVAGFLPFNLHPAKGFMGGVGSIPLGFLLGWLLLRSASYGHWAPIVILPMFYFVDTAVTYTRRIGRGLRFWEPHHEYLYQRASSRVGHAKVVGVIVVCNVCLLGLAIAAARGHAWTALVAAAGPVTAAYVYLARLARGVTDSTKAS